MRQIGLFLAFIFGIAAATPAAAIEAADGGSLSAPISVGNVCGDETPDDVEAAFLGFDVVARFPRGVHPHRLGRLVVGEPQYVAKYKGADFWFVSPANAKAFEANPAWYMPPVGGYCLGAMAEGEGRLVTGLLQNVYYVREFRTWAVFGSEHGPNAWARMTPRQRRAALKRAVRNYHH